MAKEKSSHVLRIHVSAVPMCDITLEFGFPVADLKLRLRRILAAMVRDTLPLGMLKAFPGDAAAMLANCFMEVQKDPMHRMRALLTHQGILFKQLVLLEVNTPADESTIYYSSSTLVPTPDALEIYATEKFPEDGQQVTSSNIAKIGLAGDRLFVTFNSGSTYVYEGATPRIYSDLLAAESVGSLIHKTVIKVLPCSVLEEPRK